MTRVVVGVSGASGSCYALRLLQRLRDLKDVETHLVVSRPGEKTLFQETGLSLKQVRELADHWHPIEAIGATIASGSFRTAGMVIVPCSVHTMSAIAAGLASNLMIRAADVHLKERRRLILMVRESPLHLGHLRTMASLAELGAIIAPPMPAFYHLPKSVDELVDDGVSRLLDLLGLDDGAAKEWQGV